MQVSPVCGPNQTTFAFPREFCAPKKARTLWCGRTPESECGVQFDGQVDEVVSPRMIRLSGAGAIGEPPGAGNSVGAR